MFKLLSKKLKLVSSKAFCFKHGDYTLLSDKSKSDKGLIVVYELTEFWDDIAGGFHSFISDKEELLRLSPVFNSLTIILNNKSMKSFIKYVNHYSKNNKRIFIEFRYV